MNCLLAFVLLYASIFHLNANKAVTAYLILQLLIGIPFALITGVDSKLSGSIFRSLRVANQSDLSPNAEFRRCKTAGATAASALGAFVWCIIILCHQSARYEPGWYSILFVLNIIPALLLLHHTRRLNKWLKENVMTLAAPGPELNPPLEAEIEIHKTEMTESIIAIGCLEGLLQFSQFYFSISAIKALFDSVPNNYFLLIVIPLMFYVVNGIEQIGSLLFSVYHDRVLNIQIANRVEFVKRRQYAALFTLLIAATFFVLHLVAGYSLHWHSSLPVIAYGFFNIIKGFAGGLSEEWNESIASQYRHHDEARFATLSALFGRLYQIGAIVFFVLVNMLARTNNWKSLLNLASWKASLTNLGNGQKETGAFIGTLTVFIFVLFGANILAYMWLGYNKAQGESTWRILVRAVIKREERTMLFTQLLRVLFVVSLILSNLLALKVVDYKGLVFAHGSVFYILLFVLINLITVFESLDAAIKTVFLGMISYIVVFVSLLLSASGGGHLLGDTELLLDTHHYNILLGHNMANLYLASFCGYSVTVVLNVALLALLSKHFETRSSIVLGAVVTFVCQVIDTLIFIWLGYGKTGSVDFASMVIGQFSMKFSVYLVMYFPIYYVIKWCKRWIGFETLQA